MRVKGCFAFLAVFVIASTAAGDFAGEMLDATFKFFHPNSTATCFLVRRDESDKAHYLVTAAHTLERTKGDTAFVVLRKAKPDGGFDRVDHKITIRSDNKPLWVRHAKQDVAVLRLTEALPTPVNALPASALADEAKLKALKVGICRPLYVLTYPQRFEANGAGFPVARHGIFASPPLLPSATHPTFHGDFTTFAGDSGAPAFIDGGDEHPVVVGIVIAQSHFEERTKSEYTERTERHPLGMGTILHARYASEVIEAAAKEAEPKKTEPKKEEPKNEEPKKDDVKAR